MIMGEAAGRAAMLGDPGVSRRPAAGPRPAADPVQDISVRALQKALGTRLGPSRPHVLVEGRRKRQGRRAIVPTRRLTWAIVAWCASLALPGRLAAVSDRDGAGRTSRDGLGRDSVIGGVQIRRSDRLGAPCRVPAPGSTPGSTGTRNPA